MRVNLIRFIAVLGTLVVGACASDPTLIEQAEKRVDHVDKNTHEWLFRKFSSRGYSGNPEKIAERLRVEAEGGDIWAQGWLGELYLYGFGVSADPIKRAKWHGKAANGGNRFSQYFLGLIYLEGAGVDQDHLKALEWLKKSAAQGFEPARKDVV